MEPDIQAELELLSTASGGRQGPIIGQYFGCIFSCSSGMFDCRILLSDSTSLAPGDRATVPIKFLCPELVIPYLRMGSVFELRDGRVIARGRVSRVLSAA